MISFFFWPEYLSSEIRGLCFAKWLSETLQNLAYLLVSLMNALVYVGTRHKPGHSLGKPIKVARDEKGKKKNTWVFVFQKYGKLWIISIGHFIKHKPLISEEWYNYIHIYNKRVIFTHAREANSTKIIKTPHLSMLGQLDAQCSKIHKKKHNLRQKSTFFKTEMPVEWRKNVDF